MSELRKLKVRLNIDLLKEVTSEIGATIRENDIPNTFATRAIKCDYVINYKGVEFGVKDMELVYDDMFGSRVAEFMNSYLKKVLDKKKIRYRQIETEKEYVYLIS